MTGGRIILPPTNPSLDSNGNPVSGSTLTYYQNNTTTLVSIYSNAALTIALANPLTSDSAGVFPQVWASNTAGYSVKWTRTGFSDVTFNDIFPDLDSSAVGTYVSLNQSQVSLGTNIATAFGTVGVGLIENAFTQTDSTTGAGTVATAYASTFGAVTFATPVNAITITNAYGLYLKDPVAGSHVTLTNKYALGVDSLKVAGAINIGGVSSSAVTGTGNIALSASPTFTGTVGFAALSGTGNIATSAGTLSTAGVTIAPDSGSGSLITLTGFSHNSTFSWAGITGSANFQIVAGGSGGVILNNAATSWSAISDYRAKNVAGDFTTSGQIIDAVPIHLAALKTTPDVNKAMFLAHELQAAVPYAVHGEKDGEAMQLVETTDPLVPILWAELRELRARVAALEAKP